MAFNVQNVDVKGISAHGQNDIRPHPQATGRGLSQPRNDAAVTAREASSIDYTPVQVDTEASQEPALQGKLNAAKRRSHSSPKTAAELKIMETMSASGVTANTSPGADGSTSASSTRSMGRMKHQADLEGAQPGRTVPPLQRSVKAFRQAYKSWWWWELSGMLFSIAGIVAAAVLLGAIHNRPLSFWVFPIGPNSILSVFITLSKTALLLATVPCIHQLKWIYYQHGARCIEDITKFDEASRGPLGALCLFASLSDKRAFLRYRTGAPLAALGTFIIFASLLMDPFAQQLISFPTQQTNITTGAILLPKTQLYDTGRTLEVRSENCTKVGVDFWEGLKYPARGPENCEWRFASTPDIDVEASAITSLFQRNSTASLKHHCESGNCTWPAFPTLGICGSCQNVTLLTQATCANTTGSYQDNCTYALPGGYNVSYSTAGLDAGGGTIMMTASGRSFTAGNWSDRPAMVAGFGFANVESYHPSANKTLKFTNRHPEAYECSWSLCARVLTARAESGQLSEETLAELPLTEVKPFGAAPFHYSPDALQTFRVADDHPAWDPAWDRTFAVTAADKLNLGIFLGDMLTTDSTAAVGRGIWEQSVRRSTQTVATGLTNQIRQGPNGTNATGTMAVAEPYIVVQWLWSIYLVGLMVWGLVVLGLTIWLSAQAQVPLWKTSDAALVFARVRGADPQTLQLGSPAQMRDTARTMRGKLRWDEQGPEFIVDYPSSRTALGEKGEGV